MNTFRKLIGKYVKKVPAIQSTPFVEQQKQMYTPEYKQAVEKSYQNGH